MHLLGTHNDIESEGESGNREDKRQKERGRARDRETKVETGRKRPT